MADIAVQASFNSGEWAPALFARVDIQKYRSGAALLENFFVDYRGGASTRAGTRFIYPAPDGQIRLIPFQETSELGYILVFTHLKLQFVSRGAVVTETPLAITGVTLANPGQITVVGNAYTVGDLIFVSGVGGTTELNDRFFLVAGLSGSQVSLNDFFGNPVDATAYGAFTSGGTSAKIYTIASPYSGTQLKDIKYAQNVSQMVLCHPDQPPYLLTIVTANNWTLNPIVFGSTAAVPGVISLSSSLAVGSVNYAYQVTSVDAGGQESGPSPTGDYLGAVDLRTTGGSIQLQWSAVSGAVSYNVYKADVSYIGAVPPGSTFGFIGFTTGTTFIDSNIAPDFTIAPPVPQNPFSGSGLYQTNVTTPGTYTTVPTVSVVGAASIVGSVAAVLTVQGTPTVGAGGAGYAIGDTVVFTNGVILRVATLTVTAVATWEPITSPFSSAGAVTSGSTPTNPVAQFSTSGIGTGVTANLTWGVGYLTILNPGTGYLANPTAVFSSGAAVATITIAPAFAGNPTVPGFFQQRLVLASQAVAPQTFYMSKPGQFFNFDVSFPTRPDDSITETLVAGVLNTIEALVSSTSGMLILTDHGSWIVNGGSSGSAVSPTAIVANAQSFNGIRTQPAPIVANYDVLYPQQKGSSVRDLSFNIYFNVFTGTDISIMPSHLFFGHQIIDWCWAEEPFKVVWAIREDGVMLSCTYMKEQEFVGWAHHITPSGSYKAIASVTEPDEETGDVFVDAAYVAVERAVSPPPPPPAACGVWTPSALTTLDVSAANSGMSTLPVQSSFGNGNWYFAATTSFPHDVVCRVPASNYTPGGVSIVTYATTTGNQDSFVVSGDKGYGITSGGSPLTIRHFDFTAWPSFTSTTHITTNSDGGFYGSKAVIVGTNWYAATDAHIIKVDTTNIATQSLLVTTSFISNGANRNLVADPINNQLFVIPAQTFGASPKVLAIDLTNFTTGGVTVIDMTLWPGYSSINPQTSTACDSSFLYCLYDNGIGDTIIAAVDLVTHTVSKTFDISLCPDAGGELIDMYSTGSFIYMLFQDGLAPNSLSVLRLDAAFTTLDSYNVTANFSGVTHASGWVWDGTSTLYVMPVYGILPHSLAWRMTP